MYKLSRSFLSVLFFSLMTIMSYQNVSAQTVIIDDNLQGSTKGYQVGGSFSSEGYKPGLSNSGKNHIEYTSPQQIPNGYVEFQIKGHHPNDLPDAGSHQGFFLFIDGRGLPNPPSWTQFQYNYFRRQITGRGTGSFKGFISCAEPTSARINSTYAVFNDKNGSGGLDEHDRDWYSETGSNVFGWDPSKTTWYTMKIEWYNKQFKMYINGSVVHQNDAGPYDFNPVNFKIWIGSAAVNETERFTNKSADIVYRNFKLVSYGGGTPPPTNVAPVITTSPVKNGIVGQLYEYNVNATGNPQPTFSLTTKPDNSMSINSSNGLIQWTPTSAGNFNVTVKAANGVNPDATQSFTINVTSPQTNTAPVITSTAVTNGNVGQLYLYDVEANGNPAPTFSLTTKPDNGMTINPSTGLIQWTPSSTGNFNVTVKAANGVAPDATQSFTINVAAASPCPSGMISYWKLDETSGNVYDDNFGPNNGTGANAPTPTAGRVSGAQQFNGTSNTIAAPRIAAYDFSAATSFTFEAWINHLVGSFISQELIVERKSSGPLYVSLKFDKSTAARFELRNDASVKFAVAGTTDLYDGKWHHVVGVRDAANNQLRIYVDGVLQNTASAVSASGFTSSDAGIGIGGRNLPGDAYPSYFNGKIDEVAIYNSALSASTILQHYNNGLANQGYCGSQIPPPPTQCPTGIISYWKLDETSGSSYRENIGSNNGTGMNAPTPTAGRVSGGQQFNGTSNMIAAPRIAAYDFSASTSFTFEAWINHPVGSFISQELILERKSSGPLYVSLKFDKSTAARFELRNDASVKFAVAGTTDLYDGKWHHVVGVRDAANNQLRIYVDGVLQNTASAVSASGFTSSEAGIGIGGRNLPGDAYPSYFNGKIDEVAIYNVALSASTILQHYNNGLANQGYCQTTLTKSSTISPDLFSSIVKHVNGSTVQLQWETISELGEGKFEVERSNNSNDWLKIGEIDLTALGESKSFNYSDNANVTGKFLYRIKFLKGGAEIFSNEIEAEVFPSEYVLYQNYPNPFNPSTKIRFAVPMDTKVSLQIYNQLGEVVAQPVNNFYRSR